MELQYYFEDVPKKADPVRFVEADLKGVSLHEAVFKFGCNSDAVVIYHNIRIIGRMVGVYVHLDLYDSNNDLFATFITHINKMRRRNLMQVVRIDYTIRRVFDGKGDDL